MKPNRSDIEKATGVKITADEPMNRHTTFGIGGLCDYFAEPAAIGELSGLLRYLSVSGLPYFTVGAGSNLLVKDGGIRGVVIRLRGDLCRLDFNGTTVTSGGGASLAVMVKECADRGLGGLEFLSGIPGTVGGAVRMNAGARSGDVAHILKSVVIMDPKGELITIAAGALGFGYRRSAIPDGSIVISAEFLLKTCDKNVIIKNLRESNAARAVSQPAGARCAGCVFKNPPGDSAGRLIEAAELKGTVSGGAEVSTKHANFIINSGSATAKDVLTLIERIKSAVASKSGVDLELEIRVLGE
jgi:UDP-N-acetylmuramate dehydrogenase